MYTQNDTRNDPESDPTIKLSGSHHQTHLGHWFLMAEMCLVVGPTLFNGWITLWVISGVILSVHIALLMRRLYKIILFPIFRGIIIQINQKINSTKFLIYDRE